MGRSSRQHPTPEKEASPGGDPGFVKAPVRGGAPQEGKGRKPQRAVQLSPKGEALQDSRSGDRDRSQKANREVSSLTEVLARAEGEDAQPSRRQHHGPACPDGTGKGHVARRLQRRKLFLCSDKVLSAKNRQGGFRCESPHSRRRDGRWICCGAAATGDQIFPTHQPPCGRE